MSGESPFCKRHQVFNFSNPLEPQKPGKPRGLGDFGGLCVSDFRVDGGPSRQVPFKRPHVPSIVAAWFLVEVHKGCVGAFRIRVCVQAWVVEGPGCGFQGFELGG